MTMNKKTKKYILQAQQVVVQREEKAVDGWEEVEVAHTANMVADHLAARILGHQ